ncbi:hypothetical protein P7C71_g3278, partial [Lecanoromycetidae sp. Uapishka_2]
MYRHILLITLLAHLTLSAPTLTSSGDLESSLKRTSLNRHQIFNTLAQDFDPQYALDDFFSPDKDADRVALALVKESWESNSFAGNDRAARVAAKQSTKSVAGGAENVKRAAEAMAEELTVKGGGKSVVKMVRMALKTSVDELAARIHDRMAQW